MALKSLFSKYCEEHFILEKLARRSHKNDDPCTNKLSVIKAFAFHNSKVTLLNLRRLQVYFDYSNFRKNTLKITKKKDN